MIEVKHITKEYKVVKRESGFHNAVKALFSRTLFYTIAQRGVKIIVAATTSFLSGGMIPLTFFPERVLAILKYLPFSSMQSTPLLIYSGNITGTEILNGIAVQIIWMMILLVIGKVAMNYAIKHVVVQGG